MLKRFDVDYNVYTAGEFRRTVTLMGQNTEDGVRKFKEELEDTQRLFKALVHRHRPQLEIGWSPRVNTGMSSHGVVRIS